MLRQIEWRLPNRSIVKSGVLPVNASLFLKICFSFSTSWKDLFWCTNDPNIDICIFCKRWSLILECFFPVSILKRYPIPENGLRNARYLKIVLFAFFVVINLLLHLLTFYCIIVTIRFRLIKSTGRHLPPKVYINSNDFLPERSYSVRKITSTFGLSSGVAQQNSEHVGKKWKSDWLILSSGKYSWFTIGRIYWKRNQTAIEVSDNPRVWLKTDNYILTVKEKKILLSDTEWLNDNIMDATQKLICKALGRLESCQSVLNCQKRGTLFFSISEEHIKRMHNGAKHWFISLALTIVVKYAIVCIRIWPRLSKVV